MRLLLANPNTTEAVTALVAAGARRAARPGTEIVAATARFGARIIGSRAEMAVAEHAALDLIAAAIDGCDAAIIAASTDSGLRAAREMFAVPVLGLTESALHVACLLGGRFATVTLSARSDHALREMIDGYGLSARCAARRVVAATPERLLADREGVAAHIADASRTAAEQDGADCVVLIGAVMCDMPPLVQPGVPVPVIEGVACAVGLAETLAGLGLPKARVGGYAVLPPRESTGLGPALAARFARGGQA